MLQISDVFDMTEAEAARERLYDAIYKNCLAVLRSPTYDRENLLAQIREEDRQYELDRKRRVKTAQKPQKRRRKAA